MMRPLSNPRRRRSGRSVRPAFTLVELTLAMVIAAILFLSLGGAVVIVTKALPSTSDPLSKSIETCAVADSIAEELRTASSVEERTSTRLRFTTPDRTGDGVAESIIYEWSGVSGAPLYRTLNGGTPVAVATDVRSFGLTYNLKTVSTTAKVTTTATSPESLFAFYDGWPGVSATSTSVSLTPASWGAEFFTIDQTSIPNNAKNVRVTRLQLNLQKTAATGAVTVGIYRAVGGGNPNPAPNPIGTEATVPVSSLPATFGWVNVVMPSDNLVAQLNKDFVIVVKGTVSNTAAWRMYSAAAAPKDATPTGMWTSNSGGQWQPNNSSQYKNDNLFYAYGTYDVESTSNVTTLTYFLRSVGMTLQAGASATGRAATTVNLLGNPQVTGP